MIPVAIVGAGPVGTALAVELARHGVAPLILERREAPGPGSRAVGLHATALSALEASGATDLLLETAVKVRVGEARRRGRSLGEVRFDRLHTRHPYVATLPQSSTEAALARSAERWGVPPVRRGTRVTAVRALPDGVEIALEGGETLRARVAVIAGGVRSRALAPMPSYRRDYPDRYLMTDCADAGEDGDRATVHLDPEGVLESFPLPGGARRYVAWVDAATEPARFADQLRAAVAERTGSDAAAAAVTAATAFGVARSGVSALRHGRVLVIGDAAHEISPIGGQGMNLGLIDAVTLAPLLVAGLAADGAPPQLARWERDRLRAAARAGRIASVNTALGRPTRRVGASLVRAALATPTAGLLARAYSMGLDPAARRLSAR